MQEQEQQRCDSWWWETHHRSIIILNRNREAKMQVDELIDACAMVFFLLFIIASEKEREIPEGKQNRLPWRARGKSIASRDRLGGIESLEKNFVFFFFPAKSIRNHLETDSFMRYLIIISLLKCARSTQDQTFRKFDDGKLSENRQHMKLLINSWWHWFVQQQYV